MNLFLLSIRTLLALVFASAGVGKIFDLSGSRKAMSDFGVPQGLVRPVAFLLPLAEIASAVFLFPEGTASWGAVAAFTLLLAFSVIIGINLLSGRTPECHCFGQLHSRPISWRLVLRNVVLAIGAAVIVWEGPGMPVTAAAGRFREMALARPLLVAALVIAVVGFVADAIILFALFQQHGRLMLRMDKLEKSGGGGSSLTLPTVEGLPIGASAPPFEVSTLAGSFPLQRLLARGKPVLLIFTDPDCKPCAELLPHVAIWEHQYAEMLSFVIITRPSPSGNGSNGMMQRFQNIALQTNHEISESYKVAATPVAVIVRPDGTIGTWLAAGKVAIQSLITFSLYAQMLMKPDEVVIS